jgi:hypothetical protein
MVQERVIVVGHFVELKEIIKIFVPQTMELIELNFLLQKFQLTILDQIFKA